MMNRSEAPRLLAFLTFLLAAGTCSTHEVALAGTHPDRGADTTIAAIDGGAVLMPEIRRRVLLRDDALWAEALRIHFNGIVLDGHIDTPTLMLERDYDFRARHRQGNGDVDLPRMFEGGLDGAFFSIYVPPSEKEGPAATRYALRMIAELKRQVAATDSARMAYSAADVRRIAHSGRKAVLMGLEGGGALASSPRVLRDLYDEGIRYVTLTHIHANAWADASQDEPRWNGINELGRSLIHEMNRIGMVVDLAHVSDETFYQALEVTRAPVLVSHSSVRALTPNVRNLDDAMLRAVGRNGGVVMINYFDLMVNPNLDSAFMEDVRAALPGRNLWNLWDEVARHRNRLGLPPATVEDVVDHIDHAVRIAGIDHVGLGSDFDGVFALPAGLQDVTRLPWITYHLLKRGYREAEIYKLLGGNVLRVLEEVKSATTDR